MQWMKTKSLAALGGVMLGIVGAVALSAAAGASGLNVGSNPLASSGRGAGHGVTRCRNLRLLDQPQPGRNHHTLVGQQLYEHHRHQ